MDFSSVGNDFVALTQLLKLAEDEAENSTPGIDPRRVTPATVGAPVKDDGVLPPEPKGERDSKAIWTDEEITDGVDDEADADDDHLKCPTYEFLYKQAIGTQDNFLGMAYVHKDASSASCEDLLVRIDLPGTASVAELTLDVQETHIKLRSPRYKLGLYLPHKVLKDKGKAEWDAKKQTLSVTLPIVREEIF